MISLSSILGFYILDYTLIYVIISYIYKITPLITLGIIVYVLKTGNDRIKLRFINFILKSSLFRFNLISLKVEQDLPARLCWQIYKGPSSSLGDYNADMHCLSKGHALSSKYKFFSLLEDLCDPEGN